MSRRKEFPAVCSATIPETQPTVRTPTASAATAGRVARGSRRKVSGAVAAISKGVSQGGGSSGGRRSGLRSSARRMSQETSSVVDCAGLLETEESGSVGAGADDLAAAIVATKVKDVVLEGDSEATSQPSMSWRCERAAPSTSPDSSPVVLAPTAGGKGDSPSLPTVAQAVATAVSASPIALSQGQAADIDADVVNESAHRERDDLPAIPLNQQAKASANGNNFSNSPANDKYAPRVEDGTGIEGGFQEGGTDGSSPSLEQSLRGVASSARQPSEASDEPDTRKKCDRSLRDDEVEGEASPRGAKQGPGIEVPVEVEVGGSGGGNSWGEGGNEELVTPARPRRQAKKFEDNIDDIGVEDGAIEREEVRMGGVVVIALLLNRGYLGRQYLCLLCERTVRGCLLIVDGIASGVVREFLLLPARSVPLFRCTCGKVGDA